MVMTRKDVVSAEIKERVEYIQKRYITNAKQNGDGFVILNPWEKFEADMVQYFENMDYTIVQRKKGCMIVWDAKWKEIFWKEAKKKKIIYKISVSIFLASIALLLYQLYIGINNKENIIIFGGIFYIGVLSLVYYAIQYDDKTYITPPKEP